MSFFNIYLDDRTKERMSQFDYNWSSVCQKAIQSELLRLEAEKKAGNQANKSNNWVTKRLEPKTFDNAVIKPCLDNRFGTNNNQVKILSDFYYTLITDIGNSHLVCLRCKLYELLNEQSRVEILFPGKDWQEGKLKLDFQLYFKYPVPPSE